MINGVLAYLRKLKLRKHLIFSVRAFLMWSNISLTLIQQNLIASMGNLKEAKPLVNKG